MTMLEACLRFAGAVQILLGISHAFFAGPLNWREELSRLSPVNRQVFWVHTYFIVLILFLCGTLALVYAPLLLEPSPLARIVLSGHALFWGFRLYSQHFIYTPDLWRGNPLRIGIHILLTGVWIYLTAVYSVALCTDIFR